MLKTTNFLLKVAFFSFFLFFLVEPCSVKAQTAEESDSIEQNEDFTTEVVAIVLIDSIRVIGNRVTRPQVIIRELPFAVGDTLFFEHLMKALEKGEQQVYNLGIFNAVQANIKAWNDERISVEIIVIERWYHWPVPALELADRNFNEWWVDQNHDFGRLIYGLNYLNPNFRGRKETFLAGFNLGFAQGLWTMYDISHLNEKGTLSLMTFARVSRNRQLAFRTYDNRLEYTETEGFSHKVIKAGAQLRFRPRIHETHFFALNHRSGFISDTIAQLNPDYYLDGSTRMRYFELQYRFESDRRDVKAYPLKGHQLSFTAEQNGLGIFGDVAYFSADAVASYFQPLGKNFYISGQIRGKGTLGDRQPYAAQQAFGYQQNVVRGYEFYVIDGQHFALSRFNLKKKLFTWNFGNPESFKGLGRLSNLGVTAYFKTYADAGYVYDDLYNEGNFLHNRFLFGGGTGIDLVLPYDIIIRLEYSFNQIEQEGKRLPENGLFLHVLLDIRDVLENPVSNEVK